MRTSSCPPRCDFVISVEVTSGLAGGECFILELNASKQISTVKHEIANRWKVPLHCIKLVHHTSVLQDDETISAHCTSTGLSLTMIVDFDFGRVLQELESSDDNCACSALREIGQLGPKGGAPAFAAVSAWLDHPAPHRRIIALKVLAQIVERGDQRGIDAAISCLDDASCEVQSQAVTTLQNIAEVGNRQTITALSACLNTDVPRNGIGCPSVLRALSELAGKGDDGAVRAVIAKLESDNKNRNEDQRQDGDDRRPMARWQDDDQMQSSMATLAVIAEKGDIRAIRALSDYLTDRSSEMKLAAVDSLLQMSVHNDLCIINLLRPLLSDADRVVSNAAMEALTKIDEQPAPQETATELEICQELLRKGLGEGRCKGKGKGGGGSEQRVHHRVAQTMAAARQPGICQGLMHTNHGKEICSGKGGAVTGNEQSTCRGLGNTSEPQMSSEKRKGKGNGRCRGKKDNVGGTGSDPQMRSRMSALRKLDQELGQDTWKGLGQAKRLDKSFTKTLVKGDAKGLHLPAGWPQKCDLGNL